MVVPYSDSVRSLALLGSDWLTWRTMIEQADELYRQRGEVGLVEESLALLSGVRSHPFKYAIEWRLSRAYFFLGQESASVAVTKDHHLKGIEAGERAVSSESKRVEGHFWLGVNLGLAAANNRSFGSARFALRAMTQLKTAIAIDETYHGAGPLRVLARLGQRLPWWLGGDKEQSVRNYERAIALAPTNTVSRIYYAELLADFGQLDRAREQLEFVIATPLDPEWIFENKRDKRLAEELLEKLKRLG